MPLISKPTGVVSQRVKNSYIWQGDTPNGTPIERIRVIVSSPFIANLNAYASNDVAEFDFRSIIKDEPNEVIDIGFTGFIRFIEVINKLLYRISFNGSQVQPLDSFYYVNATHKVGYDDKFQNDEPFYLVDDIYAWNSFPVFIPIFVNTNGYFFSESFNSSSSTPDFEITQERSIYTRVLTDRLPQGDYNYFLDIDGDVYNKTIKYIDRCKFKGVNLIEISENYLSKSQGGGAVFRGNVRFGSGAAISSGIADPEGGNRANNISALSLNTSVSSSNMFFFYENDDVKAVTVSFFVKAPTPSDVGVDISIRTVNSKDGDVTSVLGQLSLEWQRLTYTFITDDGDQAILIASLSRFEFFRYNVTEGAVVLDPIQSPIPFKSMSLETDFYLRWKNQYNGWEYWLFDEHSIDIIEPSSRGITQNYTNTSLGKEVDFSKLITASNLSPDQYRKVSRILYASKVERLTDNDPSNLVFSEVFVSGDLEINSKRIPNFIQIELREQPFRNN